LAEPFQALFQSGFWGKVRPYGAFTNHLGTNFIPQRRLIWRPPGMPVLLPWGMGDKLLYERLRSPELHLESKTVAE